MVCPKCGSNNVNVQIVNDIKLKNVHHSIIWWFCVGWWWLPFKWLFLTLPALLFKIFGHRKQKIVSRAVSKCVCQNCGNTWNA